MKNRKYILIGMLTFSIFNMESFAYAKNISNHAPKGFDKKLSPFRFKSIEAGIVTDPHAIGECNISDGDPDKLVCNGYDSEVAGLHLPVSPQYEFYQLKLTNMLFLYPRQEGVFAIFSDAFTQKYGPACKLETSKWRNSMGAVLDNPTLTWCFSTGELTLQAIGSDIRYGLVMYVDRNSASAPKAKVDF